MIVEAILHFMPLLAVLVALIGWWVVHWLNTIRDRKNHNRQVQTDFLIKAFQRLANASLRTPSPPYFRDMEAAVADIQLFGSSSQIQMVTSFTEEFAENNMASLNPLLNSLRDSLRKKLGYEPIEHNVRWFRPEGSPIIPQPELLTDVVNAAPSELTTPLLNHTTATAIDCQTTIPQRMDSEES